MTIWPTSTTLCIVSRPATVAIAHDYLTQRGGAERVVLAISRAFPSAPIVTALYNPTTTFAEFHDCTIISSVLQRVPAFLEDHRQALPFYAPIFSTMTVKADVTICSSSGWAHGIGVTGRKLLYVHNTARWLYQLSEYAPTRDMARRAARILGPPLRRWDRRRAVAADLVLTNSKVVQQRVWEQWGLDSEVVYPPHGMDPQAELIAVPGLGPGFLLTVGRLLPYKRTQLLVESMQQLPHHKLVIVGTGPEQSTIRRVAPQNCHFLNTVNDAELRWLYANCIAFVSAAHEDFGIAPLEAMAFGRPVVVLRDGGFRETVSEGVTGVFFDEPTIASFVSAIMRFDTSSWDGRNIAVHAERYNMTSFVARIQEIVGALTS